MRYFTMLLVFNLIASAIYPQLTEEQFTDRLNDSLKANSRNADFLFVKGSLLAEKNKFHEAIEMLSLSLQYLDSNKMDKLKAKKIINERPLDSVEVIALRAYCYDKADSLEKAIKDYRFVQSKKPYDFFYSVAVSQLYIKRKEFDKAQKEIGNISRVEKNSERGMVQQAILYYESKRYKKALYAVEIALQKFPASIEGLLIKVKIHIKQKKVRNACLGLNEAKTKLGIDYFGGQRGYLRRFKEEIDALLNANCK